MSSFEVVLQLLFSIFGLLLLLLFMFGFIKKSSFGVVVFFANSWLLLGLYICPILFVFGFEPLAGNVYMKPLLSYGVAASLHCLLLAVGMVVGGGIVSVVSPD
ncbi:MAG: hypothetical protein IPL05_04595 [Betaproteobacteria bacterium]|nr:hypothetical protein [Betaproteobacteria bacterium]